MSAINRKSLEDLYARYNRREFVRPDPLQFLYDYEDPCDREIVGLIASSLAYGRVAQVLSSVSSVLERMGPSPRTFLRRASRESLWQTFADFRHRFTTGGEICSMLLGIKHIISRYGSLGACFIAGMNYDSDTILPALSTFVKQLTLGANGTGNSLLPSPTKGSACKRLNLFLRWMVRQDNVDPGGWNAVPAAKLIVPLDTHMHRICLALKLTRRRQANMATALEVTSAFRRIAPHDPVRYDFALTRLGIRQDANLFAFLGRCDMPKANWQNWDRPSHLERIRGCFPQTTSRS